MLLELLVSVNGHESKYGIRADRAESDGEVIERFLKEWPSIDPAPTSVEIVGRHTEGY